MTGDIAQHAFNGDAEALKFAAICHALFIVGRMRRRGRNTDSAAGLQRQLRQVISTRLYQLLSTVSNKPVAGKLRQQGLNRGGSIVAAGSRSRSSISTRDFTSAIGTPRTLPV